MQSKLTRDVNEVAHLFGHVRLRRRVKERAVCRNPINHACVATVPGRRICISASLCQFLSGAEPFRRRDAENRAQVAELKRLLVRLVTPCFGVNFAQPAAS